MNVAGIVKDSLKYPLTDWKKILILGIITMIITLDQTLQTLGVGMGFLFSPGIFGLIFGLLIYGYEIRILKASLAGFAELPYFNSLFDMIIDGIKVIIVGIAYAVPLILIIVGGGFLGLAIESMGTNNAIIFSKIWIITTFLYLVIAFPLLLMSLANMAFYDGDLEAAFKFREIVNKIANIGWGNFILWYIVTVIMCLVLIIIGALFEVIFTLIQLKIIGVVLVPLIVIPYLSIYIFRSTALFYLSEDPGYLECRKCGGYYELQPGESSEDFEKCQCGGDLNYTKQSVTQKRSFIEKLKSLNKKQSLILVGILALIIGIPFIFAQHMPQHMITTNSTLIGTYSASNLSNPNSDGAFVVIPPGTTNIKIEYNLSWTPVDTGTNGIDIQGYNTNVTDWGSVPLNEPHGFCCRASDGS